MKKMLIGLGAVLICAGQSRIGMMRRNPLMRAERRRSELRFWLPGRIAVA